jgi:putative ABC transport system ATP-binding protein
MIDARAVVKTYPMGYLPLTALGGVDLRVRARELVALVGPPGCGKTTLLHCLAGLSHVDSGTILVAGRRVSRLRERDRPPASARQIGVVFQAGNLLPLLFAVENVELPLLMAGVGAGDARRRALAALDQVGLAQRATDRPDELTDGERQRVAIARAMVNHPAVLLVDDPTSDLDAVDAAEVMDLLVRLHQEQGLTMVIATPSAEVGARASRIVRMSGGLLLAEALTIPPLLPSAAHLLVADTARMLRSAI